MKRSTICLLSLLPALALASCSSSSDEPADKEAVTPGESIAAPIEDTASPEAPPAASEDSEGESSLDSGGSELIALGDIAFNTTPPDSAPSATAPAESAASGPQILPTMNGSSVTARSMASAPSSSPAYRRKSTPRQATSSA